ncbi:MAG: carboxynorspermidine decarboxylase [Eubacterium sp.]|nr:carboxynorspermidine decarboxylase [Eubacterium sp.]
MLKNINVLSKCCKTPAYLTSEGLLIKNLEILRDVERRAGCKILLAQKAFSQYSLYPLIGEYISGTTASGLYEARLGREKMGGETHVFSPAYCDEDFGQLLKICDHIVFNSFSQWEKFKDRAQGKVSCGLRLNPECSTQSNDIYDPCSPFSRLGITIKNFMPELLAGVDGFHFHTLCEQGFDALEKTLKVFFDKFGQYVGKLKWLNFGGGHHITRPGYDIGGLIEIIIKTRKEYGVEVYLEPGEAIALNAGFLAASVLDIVDNGMKIAILNVSAACHMPDVLEVPYTPQIDGAEKPGIKQHSYRLAGNTCLAGDIIGDYSFDNELLPGDKIIFKDMAIYSMVKNNTFNGMPLPSIGVIKCDGKIVVTKEFGYEDFKMRL